MSSSLVTKNVTISGRRTSIRLEPEMWRALEMLCRREGVSLHQFCSRVDSARGETGLTSAIRAEIVTYFLAALERAEAGG